MAPTGTVQEKNHDRDAQATRRACHPNPDATRTIFYDVLGALRSRTQRRILQNATPARRSRKAEDVMEFTASINPVGRLAILVLALAVWFGIRSRIVLFRREEDIKKK